MKRNLFVSGIMIFLAFFMVGCKGNTYSKLLKKEQKKIKNYISRMDIRIVSSTPDVKQGESWPEKDYISMPTYEYFYFHLSTPLDTLRDVIHAGDVVNVRYRKYGLDSYTDTISCWTTDDAGEPITFTVGSTADYNTCPAWNAAILQMKYSGSECKIICPSTAGFDADNSSVTPYGYDLRVTKRK